MADDIDELARLIKTRSRTVAFTGAGISTECGIPDFRSPGGVWTRFKPIPFQEFTASAESRLEAFRRYFHIYDDVRGARPGRGHLALAELHGRGILSHVVTQNIDGLHLASGVPADRIIELHGNGTYCHCLACGARHELEWVREFIAREEKPPACEACGGIVKTATISFGQAMPEEAMAAARAATLNSDLFLSLGSSLQVFPAASFPVIAKAERIPLVIINREPTGLDGIADLVINDDIGDVMSAVMARLSLH
jgi:NAD-dependent deacetylase